MEFSARPLEMYPDISHLKKTHRIVVNSGTILFSYLVLTLCPLCIFFVLFYFLSLYFFILIFSLLIFNNFKLYFLSKSPTRDKCRELALAKNTMIHTSDDC